MRLLKVIYTLGFVIAAATFSYGQLPSTNIYSLDLKSNEQKVLLDNLTLLTSFNEDGYNNQPHFISDQDLLITSDYESRGLTDILHLNLAKNEVTRVTWTEESEYSPTVMANGADFSIVRQEVTDSQQIPQVLWSYPMDRSGGGQLLINDLDNIGYHAWVTKDKVALYLVSEPSELVVYDTKNKTSTHITYNVGRCLKTDNNGHIYYLHQSAGVTTIRSHDIYLGRSRRVAPALDGQQDFDLLPNGHLIAADGARLMTLIPGINARWNVTKDLSAAGIKSISRITSSRGKLAIVTAD